MIVSESLRRTAYGVAVAFVGAASLFAQPGPPKNLQVLPKDTSGREVFGIMRSVTQGLGVQCDYCHVPREFDKDDKPEKEVARAMFKMTMDLKKHGEDFLPGGREAKISCWTCHRGAAKIELPPPPPPPGPPGGQKKQ